MVSIIDDSVLEWYLLLNDGVPEWPCMIMIIQYSLISETIDDRGLTLTLTLTPTPPPTLTLTLIMTLRRPIMIMMDVIQPTKISIHQR